MIATVGQYGSDTGITAPVYQLWNSNITQIGSSQPGSVSQSSLNTDAVSFTGASQSQLSVIRLRLFGQSQATDHGGTESVNWIALTTVSGPTVNAAITMPACTAAVSFQAPGIAAVTSATASAAPLAVTSTFPQAAAGLINASASPSALNVVTNQPQVGISTVTNVALTATALTCASNFPGCTVNNVGISIPPVTQTTSASFPPCAVAAGASAALTLTSAYAATFPLCTVNHVSASAAPAQLGASCLFLAALISTVINASLTPPGLTATAAFPPCTASDNTDGPYYAASVNVLGGGSGSWTNTGNVTGPPDGSAAVWTVP